MQIGIQLNKREVIKQCVTVKLTRSRDTIPFKGQSSSLIDRALTQPRPSSGTHRPEVSPPLPIGTEVHLSIASPLENLETARSITRAFLHYRQLYFSRLLRYSRYLSVIIIMIIEIIQFTKNS